jgi:hypothetical protein
MAMMAITTSKSIKVKARRAVGLVRWQSFMSRYLVEVLLSISSLKVTALHP